MGSDHADPDHHEPDLQPADPMHTLCRKYVESLSRLEENAASFLPGQFLVGLILQLNDLLAFVVISHTALKCHERTPSGILHVLSEFFPFQSCRTQ